ncbi:MAG: hypothetical protein EZS28_005205 [Streblomastix strix]|uniref:Uncharacterized protein n=1 Tax=Streblomastix strix TaxID=222440 RepID=A0A5J4WW75_9EUKA|nr:MAG: hypothetical protein EZS28_005205 [Streblomastix strix]
MIMIIVQKEMKIMERELKWKLGEQIIDTVIIMEYQFIIIIVAIIVVHIIIMLINMEKEEEEKTALATERERSCIEIGNTSPGTGGIINYALGNGNIKLDYYDQDDLEDEEYDLMICLQHIILRIILQSMWTLKW